MSTQTYTTTHSANYIADRILGSLKDIIRDVGLSPAKFMDDWEFIENSIKTWLEEHGLKTVFLEIYDSSTDKLVIRTDFDIKYDGEEMFWDDGQAIRTQILKLGKLPNACGYRLVVQRHDDARQLDGWSSTNLRDTIHLAPTSVGTAASAPGMNASGRMWS